MKEPIMYADDLKKIRKKPVSNLLKRVPSSNYKRVELRVSKDGTERWIARMLNMNTRTFDNEREAAIAVDKDHILNGRDPVNILKKPATKNESSFWCMKHDNVAGQNVCTSQCNDCKSQSK